jgi:NAD(P)-dependent dehydrogenase (short-subunit alcohol dehydrogenase family)
MQLAAKGCTVLVGGRSLDAVTKACADMTGTAVPFVLDINDSASIQAAVQKVTTDYGRLDILVNNAGSCFDAGGDFTAVTATTITRDELINSFDLNLFRQVEMIQEFLPVLKAAPYANVVNISSIVGSITAQSNPEMPLGKPLGYAASKSALNMMTVMFAAALKDTNVRINAAHPGWAKTESGGGDTGSPYQMEVSDAAKTPVHLAMLGHDDGKSGIFLGPSDTTASSVTPVDW